MTWPIIGHEWAVELLSQALAAKRLAHAYLFSGAPQTGKTRLAMLLAQAVNCRQPDAPCGQCPSCRKTENWSHPDVHLVEEADTGGVVKIEQIRALQREAVLAPYEGRRRVIILRRIDRASPEAANSLLKTLEEPPPKVIMVLTAVEPDALPATVLSRCQRIDLRPVALSVIEAALVDRGVAVDQARLLAHLSGGRVGWALNASEDDTSLRLREDGLGQFFELLSASRVARFDFAYRASRDVPLVRDQLELWSVLWRDLLHICVREESHVVNVDHLDQLRALARRATLREALDVLQALQITAEQLEANVNPRLALEGLMLKLPFGVIATQR
jgi:DNA polymerase-3 subunit delta'